MFILFVPTKYAVQLQLLGGIWIIQTLPAVMLGAYTRWFNSWALLIGWAVGTYAGTSMAIAMKTGRHLSAASSAATPSRATLRSTP